MTETEIETDPEPDCEYDVWKTMALRLTGLVIEYDKLVCRLQQDENGDQSQQIHLLLRTVMNELCASSATLNSVVAVPER